MIEIKDNNEVLVLSTPIGVGSKRKFELMKDDYITLKFSLLNPISFKMGCYAECDFGRFEIIEDQKPSFNNSTGGYDYELKMEASYMKWKNKVFKYTPETGGNEAAWDLTAQLSYHLDIFLRNLKVWGFQYGGEDYEYEIDNDVNVDALVMHYSNTNLIDALTSLAEAANCEWWMEGKKIRFGRCEKGEAVEISLGEEAETMSLSKSSGDYFTRIYAFGSTQNISSRYRKKLEFTIDTLNRSGNKSDFKDSKKPVNPSFFRKDLIKYYSYEKQMDGVGSVSASLATPDVEEYELYDSITINAMQLYKSAYVLDLSSMVFSYDFSSFPNAVLDVRVEIVASGNDSSTVLSESSYTIDSSNKTLRLSKERFESPYETIRKLYLRITYSCVSPLVTYIPYTIVGDCILGSVYGYVETDVNYVSDDGGNHKIGVTINRNAMPYTDEHATLLYETTSNDKLYIGAKFTIEGLVKGNVPLGYFDSDVDGLTVNGVVQRRLMLPEGTPYIDVYPDMSPDEVIEGIVTFDYIYPRKVLSISSVEEEMIDTTEGEEKKPTGMKVPVYTIKTTGLVGFDKSYVISEELTVTFQTGKLAGLTFGLTFLPDKSDGTSTCFEIVANEDYGGRLPDTVMKPEANNEFVMAGYDTEYVFENLVPEAEEELKTETEKYAEKIRNNIGTVSAKLMSDWSKARNETQDTPCPFGVGQKVRVNNPSFFPSPRTMRVLGYELALDIPWDSPVYTIGESASYSRLGALEDKIDSIKLNGSVYFSGKVSSSTSGTNVYLIKKDDETDPSDTNAYSSLRTDKEIKDSINKNNRELDNKFVSKLKDDTASGIITFLRGLIIGNFSSGESGGQISDDGAAELASLLLRGALEIGKYSAGKSGAKIGEDGAAELLSMLVRGLVTAKGIQSPGFSTGALGTGLCLKMDENGDSYIEVDRMLVRKVAEFIQLVIQEIKHVGGQIVLTPASMKCIRVEDTGDSYRCYFEATDGEKTVENQFVAGDQARAQTFNVKEGVNENVKNTYYWRLVTGVGDNYIDLSKTDCDAGSTVPAAGDEIVQLGNRNDVARQAAIILSAYGNDAPYFKMYRGINSYKLEGKEFVNLSREDVMIISDNIKLSTGETVKEYINGAVGDVQSKVDEVSGKVEDAVERLAEQQNYIAALQKIIEDLQDQIDGVIESHYGKTDPTTSNYPANEWTTEEQKQAHSNDTYTNLSTGKSWKWVKDGDTWKWNAITDTATEKALAAAAKAQDTADGKRRVFVSQPTTGQAYDVGDLWVNATYWETYKNDLLRCKTAKKENEAFSISHWELASRYTDDTKANEAAEAAREAAEAANAAQEAADEAAATAGEAKTEAQTANTELDNLKSDGTISPVEKTALKQQHADIKAEHGQITSEAGKYSISVTDYEAAYKKADAALTKYTASTPEYITVESDYSDISAYYSKRQTILDTIAVKAKEASDAAKKAADDAAAKAEEAAESASEAAQKAIEAKTAADNAATAAKNAQTDADEANSMLSDIANDNKLTAQEKQQTKKEWDVIVSEKPKNDVSADKFGVSKTAYGSAYTALSTYITPLLSDLSSTSNITGTEFRAKFKAYYDARTDLLNAISAKAKELADNAQEAADAAAENASQAIEDAAAAKNAADKAQADVDAEKERMDEWAADGKFSPSEKKQLKEELARIDGDKTQVTDGYTKYGLGTPTAYNTAYTNYRTAINGVVSSSSETVAIPSDFATKRTAYYTQKSAALTAISDAAKAYADKVVAGIEVGGRNILMETNQGKKTWYASTSDGPSLFITTEWVDEGVKGVKIELTKQPSSWGVITRSLEGTLDLLEPNTTYMLSFDILSNISNTLSTTIMNSNATGRLSNSPSFSFEANKKKHVVLKLVTNDLSEKGSSQVLYFGYHSVGYLCFKNLKLEKGNVATAWTPAIEDVNGMIEDAQKAADDAAEAAKNAQADATNANNELTNIKSDNLISPIEKTALKQQQADIRSEYGEITANAARYAVSTTAYKSAYDLANAALTKYTASSPEYITVGSDYANISAYYDARKTILDAIAAAAKKAADDATNKANQAVEDAARAGHYYLDLDNDSGQVACDADGNVTGGYPTTNAKVWYGTEVDTGWSFKGTFSGCTGSVGASSGAVTVTAVSKDDASVTITATKSGKPELSAVFTIVKVKSGRDGEDGANGTSVTVKSTSVTYAVSTSGTTAPASGWSATIPSVPVGQYLWSKTVVTYSDGKSTTTHSCSYQGKNGANGTSVTVTAQSTKYAVNTTGNQPADSAFTATSIPSLSPGQYLWSKTEVTYSNGVTTKTYAVSRIGSDGANGTPGAAGANGKTSYVHFAYAKSADGNTGFSTTYFSGALYVGTCTDFNTADPTSYTAYTWARLKGEDGANGTSVTVKSTSVTYAVSTSGTTAPASGWSATIPSVPVGQYLWSKTVVTYSDGKSTTTHSCSYQGKNGANGTSVTVTAQSTKYAVNTTGNQPADSAFTATSIPSLSPGQYLWSKTEVTYSNGVTTKTYAVSRIGSDGANGTPGAAGANGKTSYVHFAYAKSADGNTGFSTTYFSGALYVGTCTDFNTADPTSYTAYTWARLKGEDGAPGNGIKSTAVTYQVSTSGTTPPTGTWSSSIPSVAANQYLWTRTVITYTDNTTSTSYSVGKMGANGAKGDKGDTGPAGADGDGIVSVSNTYQIGSSGTTAPTGSWSSTVPSPQKGKYLWTKTVTTYKKSDPTTVYSVSYYGTDGTAAKYVRVAGDQVFIYANNFSGNPTPTSITLTATLTGTSGYQWSYKQAGQTSFTNISGATSQTYALAHNNSTVWGSAKSVTIRCTSGGVYDEMTIAKVSSGTNGTNGKDGTNGTNGKDGADGKNGADAYTVILGNESHAFQGTTSAAIAASTKCEVIAYKGATRVAATIGTITGAPSGMSTSISSNGTTSASFTVSVTSSLTTGQGVLTVPITVDGKSFTKNFSFSVAFKGNTGATGATGPKGDAAVFYTIEPSANVVKKSWDNKLTPTSVTCTKYKQTGSNARATTTEKTLKYQRVGTDSSVQTAASGSSVTVSPTSTTTSIKFWLYDGSNIIMMQEVPVVGDAVDVYTKVHAEITAAEGEIGLLSTKVTTVTDSVTGLEKEVETNTAEIKSAKGQISSTASQVSSLGTRVSTVEQTASGLTTTVNGLNGKVSKLEQTDSSLTSRITSAEGKVSTIEQKVSSISLKVDGIDPVNLFRDGSFESGYNTFRTSGSGKDDVEVGISANGKVGKNAMMVKWPGKRTTVYLEQKPFVNPNATYTVSFWMYTNVATNYQAFVINALDKNDNNLSVNDSTLNIEIPGTKWTQFIHRFTTPANTERLEFYFRASANVENGTISYIDGFMLLKGDYLDNIPSYFIPNDSVNGDTLLSTGIDIENKKVIVTSDQFVIQNNDGEVTASVNEDGVLSVGSGEFSGFIRTIPRIITKNTGDNGDVEFKDNYYQISLSNLYKGGFIYVDVESNSYAGDGIKLPLGLKYAGARVTIVNKYPAKRLIITTRHEALDPGYGDWSDDENNAMRLGGVQISHVEMGNVSTQGNNRFVELLAVPYYLDETIGSVKYQGQVEWVVLNNQEFTTANNTTGGKYAKFK
ncbi:Chromosome partition protein Smc [Paraprevotella clara]|uniref:Chromosome partition protein Smc n=1 Tax=Paraprevotella clara TaxID=454154 RepID=A0A6N3ESA8_9BACT